MVDAGVVCSRQTFPQGGRRAVTDVQWTWTQSRTTLVTRSRHRLGDVRSKCWWRLVVLRMFWFDWCHISSVQASDTLCVCFIHFLFFCKLLNNTFWKNIVAYLSGVILFITKSDKSGGSEAWKPRSLKVGELEPSSLIEIYAYVVNINVNIRTMNGHV